MVDKPDQPCSMRLAGETPVEFGDGLADMDGARFDPYDDWGDGRDTQALCASRAARAPWLGAVGLRKEASFEDCPRQRDDGFPRPAARRRTGRRTILAPGMADELLTPAELSERSGVEVRTLRRWITQGVVPGGETAGRNARYAPAALTRARAARAMRELYGMSLPSIRQDLITAD